jgi:hypothetical protein
VTTFTPTDDRLDLFGRVDLTAEFLAAGMTQGRNRQWSCPNPQHAQTGATPPVSIGGPNGDHLWKCHGCGVGGSVVDLYRLVRGIGTAEAFALVREKVGTPGYRPPPPRPTVQPVAPPDADSGRLDPDRSAEVVEDYLNRRGWIDAAAEAFGLYAVRGRFRHPRVRHPYRVAGEVRWWQDRAVYEADTGPKWDNPKNLPRMPYALDLRTTFEWAEDTDPPSIFVAEGAADVVALWHANPGAACIGIPGTKGVDQWVRGLRGLDVLIVTDPDEAGDDAAHDLAIGIHAAGGRSARLRPPVDLDDWLARVGPDGLANGLQLLANRADWWTP